MRWFNYKQKIHEVSKKIQLPTGSILNTGHMEINSNKEVIIEGSKGVIDYDDSVIKVDMGKMKIIFIGRNLILKCLTTDSLIIEGTIASIEFVT